jgi:hypothetical protein
MDTIPRDTADQLIRALGGRSSGFGVTCRKMFSTVYLKRR